MMIVLVVMVCFVVKNASGTINAIQQDILSRFVGELGMNNKRHFPDKAIRSMGFFFFFNQRLFGGDVQSEHSVHVCGSKSRTIFCVMLARG